MYCSQCGTEVPDNAQYCSSCGMPLQPKRTAPLSREAPSARQRRQAKKRSRLLLVAVIAAVILVSAYFLFTKLPANPTTAATLEGQGYDTAEDAVLAYVQALKNGDYVAMLETFAIETYVEKFNLSAYLERVSAYIYPNMILPGDAPLTEQLNVTRRVNEISNSLFYQLLTLCAPDSPLREAQSIRLDDETPSALLERILPSGSWDKLSALSVGEFRQPLEVAPNLATESAQSNLEQQRAFLGADELRSMALELSLNGKEYLFCPYAVRYGDRWYLSSLYSSLSIILNVSNMAGGLWDYTA